MILFASFLKLVLIFFIGFRMTEKPSDTSNYQRFEEMFCHLTPRGAVIPYNVTEDPAGNLWIAAKGGLFKLSPDGKEVLFEKKNPFPKKMAAYCQVACYKDTIIHTQADDNDKLTEFRFYSLDGEVKHEQFIDGLLQSVVVDSKGNIYVTKQLAGADSAIHVTSMDTPLGWDELMETDEYAFQTLCVLDDDTLVAATTSMPINMYSRQWLKVISIPKKTVVKSFSEAGKNPGRIFFPRQIRKHGDGIIVLDKTGKFQQFTREGVFEKVVAEMDAYLGNGFIVQDGVALIVCSGIVQDSELRTICDDWLERLPLDGSTWKALRREVDEEKKVAGDLTHLTDLVNNLGK